MKVDEKDCYEDQLKGYRIRISTLKQIKAEGRAEGSDERAREIAKNLLSEEVSSEIIEKLVESKASF